MTLRHLRIFDTVCRHGSITQAAEVLFMAQPAVSLCIKEMERLCGMPLFERHARKLHLTPFGEEMLSYAQRILAIYDEMEMIYTQKTFPDIIRIGTGTALGKMYFPRFIHQFQEEHPNANIYLYIDRTDINAGKLNTNDLDFVIMESIPPTPHVVYQSLQTSPIVAICRMDHPLSSKSVVTAEELAQYPLLLREKSSPTNIAVTRFFFDHNIPITPIWESISVMALFNAVLEGLGIAFVSKNHIDVINNGQIHVLNIADFDEVRHIGLYHHKDKQLTPLMKTFLSDFKKYINEINNI